MKKIIFVLISVFLIACQQRLIGGDKDSHGCLTAAGYSWNDTIGACTRAWELDESQVKAAQIAVAPLSYRPVTVEQVETLRCPGCFIVHLNRGDTGSSWEVRLISWKITENSINSFDDCVAAGNPVMESYPKQCRTPDGITYIEIIQPNTGKEICGGWDTYGEVVCDCTGSIQKDSCPSNAECDSGYYYCRGACGECRCFQGDSSKGKEEPCNGTESYYREFKHVCTEQESLNNACTMNYNPVCGEIVLNMGKTVYQTFGNGCSACAAMKVVSYTRGECPPEKTADMCSDQNGNYLSLKEAADIANSSECGYNLVIACTCPKGYRKEGDVCNPECYYSNPKCLAPSVECEKTYICNEGTGTYWINLNITKQGCNPACVISLETQKAEINWRCTGLI